MVRVRRRVAVAVRHAEFPITMIVPAAPSNHPVGTCCWASWIGLIVADVAAVPVLAPFPHIAAHVEQTQLVGCFGADGMGGGAAVIAVPCYITEFVAARVFVTLAAVPAASGVLPFGLGGQAEVLAGQLVQLGDERLTVIPAYALHGSLQVAGEASGVAAQHRLPQLLGDLGLTDAVAAESHQMGGFLVTVGIAALLGCGSHGERAALDRHHKKTHTFDNIFFSF